jgi:glutathione S-transferase
MKTLYHFPLCPLSRQIRVLLKELDFTFNAVKEEYWVIDQEFLRLNPAGELPVLIDGGVKVCGIYPIIEYLIDEYKPSLMDFTPFEKAEIRRIISWFNTKFYREVSKYILDEKMVRLFNNAGSPRSEILRVAKDNLSKHLKYLSKILEDKEYLALQQITIADLVAASHLSSLDFLDEISWDQNPSLKYWYSLIKSRPSFRPLLLDRLPGFTTPKHYADLDF